MQALIALGQWLDLAEVLQSMVSFLNNLQANLQRLIEALARWTEGLDIPGAVFLARVLAASKPYILWICIAVGGMIVLLTLRSKVFKPERESDRDLDTQAVPANLAGMLRSAFRRGLRRLAGRLNQAGRLRQAEDWLAAARIRRIYARVLRLSASLDRPRPASRTPLEFLPNLQDQFPALQAELGTITQAYLRVRYGELSETRQELEVVEEAWRRVAVEGRSQLAARREKGRKLA
jgi:hypothetical protein